MGKIFNIDSPFMNALSKLADLIYLNILTAICCIPVFTIGASMTALHYVLLKMAKNEEGYITKDYFKSFKQNFKEATLIWLIFLLAVFILCGDFVIFKYSGISFPKWLQTAVIAVGILLLFATVHLFPVLARFDNNIACTYRNSLFIGILNLPKTVLMMLCWAIPVVITVFFPQAFPVVIALGISGPAFLNVLLYKKSFKRFEPEEEITPDEAWAVEENPEQPGGEEEQAEKPEEDETLPPAE